MTIKTNTEKTQRHQHFHLGLHQSRVMGVRTGALVSSLVLRLLTQPQAHCVLTIPSVRTSKHFQAELALTKPGLICITALRLWLFLQRNLLLQSPTCSPAGFAVLEAFSQTYQKQHEKQQRGRHWWMAAGTTDHPRQQYTPKDTSGPNLFHNDSQHRRQPESQRGVSAVLKISLDAKIQGIG